MGLADLMYHCGVRYGSDISLDFASQVMEFIRYHCMLTSIRLAAERGPSQPSRVAFMIRQLSHGSHPHL